ncbi:MAG: EAL domain-containing protein [Cyanobacteriota bacterium]|nr:EAL domain-containing protein [Cyanobacteriota bacterium]
MATQHILFIEDPQGSRAILLEPSTYSIGREESHSIVLHSRLVSRHHATLFGVQYPGSPEYSFWIVDGDAKQERSTNGLIVNGKRRLCHKLKHGDLILFGGGAKASYQVEAESSSPVASYPPSPELQSDSEERYHSETHFLPKPELKQLCDAALARLASFPELSPHPIIEVDLDGRITYLNPAALTAFPNLQAQSQEHPLLSNLLETLEVQNVNLLHRSIQVNDRLYEQSIHYITESRLVRSYLFDITERHEAVSALRQSEATNHALVHAIPDAMLRIDVEGKLVDFKAPSNFEFPIDLARGIGFTLDRILPSTTAELFEHYLQQTLETGDIRVFEFQLQLQGSLYDYEARYVTISTQEVLCMVRDITARKHAEQMIHYQAFYDELTGLPNRSLFNQHLEEAIANAKERSYAMGVMFLDIDRFKTINDTLGHANGDRVVYEFGQRLSECMRSSDVVARWGGDEFTILLPYLKNPEAAQEIAQRILDTLKTPFQIGDRELYIGSSIGIALYPEHGDDSETLLRNADVALYRVKEQGRQNFQLYIPAMNSQASMRLSLENSLYQALEREEFSLYYQPQIDVTTGKITGMEALLRWYHPHFGLVSPDRFIPLAEETGTIVPIGEWILQTACAQNQAWHAAGFGHLKMSVNLSVRQFQHPHLVSDIAKILQDTGLDAQFLELEITETTLMQNIEMARPISVALQEMGIHLALDDFGTGYSSLGYLKQLPFHTLKIDRSFIHDLDETSPDMAIVSAILALGSGLDLRVIAEGVETQFQLDLLSNLNCRQMQGYLFAAPLKALDATKFLLEHSLSLTDDNEM